MVRVRLNLAPDILGILDNRAKGGSKEIILDSGTLGVYLKSLFWAFILGVYSTSLFWEFLGLFCEWSIGGYAANIGHSGVTRARICRGIGVTDSVVKIWTGVKGERRTVV